MTGQFRRGARVVDARLFDGSPAAAAAICAQFGCRVEAEGHLDVPTPYGRSYIGAGVWVVRDRATRVLSIVSDQAFADCFEPIDPALSPQLGQARATNAGMITW